MDTPWTVRDLAREWTRDPADRERQATWALLSLLDDRVTRALVGDDRPTGFDPDALLSIGWSETEELIARSAVALYRGTGQVDLGRLARGFSPDQMQRLRKALELRRGDCKPETWHTRRVPMRGSSASVVRYEARYSWLALGERGLHAWLTKLPCRETIRTPVREDTEETIRQLVLSLRSWDACGHGECRLQFALSWAWAEDAVVPVYRVAEEVGDASGLFLLMRNGTKREQEMALKVGEECR